MVRREHGLAMGLIIPAPRSPALGLVRVDNRRRSATIYETPSRRREKACGVRSKWKAIPGSTTRDCDAGILENAFDRTLLVHKGLQQTVTCDARRTVDRLAKAMVRPIG